MCFSLCGRLSPEKNLDMLLYAASELERRFPGGLYPAGNLGINRYAAGVMIPPLGEPGSEDMEENHLKKGDEENCIYQTIIK
jgi:hypothetical protein